MPRPFEIIDAIDKAAALSIPAVRKIFDAAARELREGITDDEIEKALAGKAAGPILSSAAWELFAAKLAEMFAIDGPLAKTMAAAYRRGMKEAPLKGHALDFAELEKATARYLKRHGARLVKDVTRSTKRSIAVIIRSASRAGTTKRAARAILKIKGFGLTRHETAQFDAWARRLYARAANPKSDLFELSARELQQRLNREYRRRLRHRAKRIANTEAYGAGNAARRELWTEAVDQGVLDADAYLLQWITRVIAVCPRCEALHEKTAKIVDGVFVSDPVEEGQFAGTVIRILRPTVHPWCYCAIRTVRRKDVEEGGSS